MPAWLLSAFQLLRSRAFAGGAIAGALPGIGIPGIDLFPDKDGPKRRRRRRALTQGDRDDLAYIVGLLGAPAGKQFALTLAGRAR